MRLQQASRSVVVGMMLVLGVAVCLQGADEKPAKKGNRPAAGNNPLLALPPSIELTSEQTKQVAEIRKEFVADAQELQQKQAALLTPEQKEARAELMKQAKADGKTRADIQLQMKALNDQLDPAAKEQQAELRKESQQLKERFLAKVSEVLTAEQKALLPGTKKNAAAKSEKKKKVDKQN